MSDKAGNGREILILYATETGTAGEIAWRIFREGLRFYLRIRCLRTDEYDKVYSFSPRVGVQPPDCQFLKTRMRSGIHIWREAGSVRL